MAEGPEIDAVVKWFNGQKGFGFVELGDGSGDAFLHIAVLQAAGRQSVLPGSKMRIATAQGPKGRQVARVIEVDESTATEAPRRPPREGGPSSGGGGGGGFGRAPRDLSSAVEMAGTVKWFNTEKGFGFIAPEGGGKDVFVHISVLGRSGLAGLAEGQQVSMRVVETPKGREAVSIAVAG
jgi:CspA family cold shock protein